MGDFFAEHNAPRRFPAFWRLAVVSAYQPGLGHIVASACRRIPQPFPTDFVRTVQGIPLAGS
jgi:hypothetical protein